MDDAVLVPAARGAVSALAALWRAKRLIEARQAELTALDAHLTGSLEAARCNTMAAVDAAVDAVVDAAEAEEQRLVVWEPRDLTVALTCVSDVAVVETVCRSPDEMLANLGSSCMHVHLSTTHQDVVAPLISSTTEVHSLTLRLHHEQDAINIAPLVHRFASSLLHITWSPYDAAVNKVHARSLARALQACKHLQSLKLSLFTSSYEACEDLTVALSGCTQLHALILINFSAITSLLQSTFDCWPKLHTLDISGSILKNYADRTDRMLAATVPPALRTLRFNSNYDEAQVLSTLCSLSTDLRTVDLSNCRLDRDSVWNLIRMLMRCSKLRELDLSGTHLHDDSARLLGDALKMWPNLEVLSLRFIYMDGEGARYMCAVLRKCPRLCALRLHVSRTHDTRGLDHGRMLADALPECLSELDLSVDLSNGGTQLLASSLQRCAHRLERLELNRCDLGDDGTQAVCDVIRQASNLQTLSLSDNGIRAVGTRALTEALRGCPRLRDLCLKGNVSSVESVQELVTTLRDRAGLALSVPYAR